MSKDHNNLGEKFALIREKDVKIPLNAALACVHFRLFKTQPMDQIGCIKNALSFDQITIGLFIRNLDFMIVSKFQNFTKVLKSNVITV